VVPSTFPSQTLGIQVETLTRDRGRGTQKMVVEHVHVRNSGQAIVGVVNQNQNQAEDSAERKEAPAMPNGRCRMHGGPSTGPRTPQGLARYD
jgi:hypothetical protein